MKQPLMVFHKKKGYHSLLHSVATLLTQAKGNAYRHINQVLVETYWNIGKQVVEYEQGGEAKAQYGSKLLDNLSRDLTVYCGKGFSRDNLERMRKFYLSFPNSATLSRKLSWSHYLLILRVENALARKFYLVEAGQEQWSVRQLDRQIQSSLFERVALGKNKQGVLSLAKRGQVLEKAGDLVKDPYVLEFLGLEESEKYSETDLEEKIITHLQRFLLELGKGFMFVARQQRITIEDEHFYIDLVFYNRILRCFLIIELKIGKLTHQDLGQLQMYVHYYDRVIKQVGENSTLGILLCADKKEAIVKYTLPQENKHIFASQYKLYLPDKEELELRLRKLLKTPEE